MNISNTPAVQSATASATAQGQTADAVNMLVLKKALNTQAAAAVTLLQALGLPLPPESDGQPLGG